MVQGEKVKIFKLFRILASDKLDILLKMYIIPAQFTKFFLLFTKEESYGQAIDEFWGILYDFYYVRSGQG